MGQLPILKELFIITCFAVAVAVVFARLHLPVVAGLLAAGALVGPYGLRLIGHAQHIELLAEIGVGLLLFSIGLEFSLRKLIRALRASALGGGLQMGLTVAITALVAMSLGESLHRGIFFGFLIALSSTAIVMAFLSNRGELDAPHGRLTVGILLFQDLCVVPMMLLIPILAGRYKGDLFTELSRALGAALFVVLVTVALSRLLIPRIFHWVDSTKMREVFLLAVLSVFLGIAWFTSSQGLSFALGAFLAGVVLADSDFGHRALSDVLPLRSTFTSIFFMSLGMLADFRVIANHPMEIFWLSAAFLLGKGILASVAAAALKFPARIAWLTGVGLAQFGEFGFVLALLGQSEGLLSPHESQLFLTAGVISMFVTPLFMSLAPHVTAGERALQPLQRLLGVRGIDEPAPEHKELSDHVVVAGFGIGGKMVADALKRNGVRYLVLELNADSVRDARNAGEPIYYGDVTSPEAMSHAGVDRARAVVLLINDPAAARRAVAALHSFAPKVRIFLRARYLADLKELRLMGAHDVVFEELESAREMVQRVLKHFGTSESVIRETAARARELEVIS